METAGEPVIYQLRIALEGVSPLIWRRLLVPGDYSIADLHFILQIAFDWNDWNLHRFFIHGKDYGIYHSGGMSFSDDPYQVKLADFKFRKGEKFRYEYDFFNSRKHLVRVEDILSVDTQKQYPLCTGGGNLSISAAERQAAEFAEVEDKISNQLKVKSPAKTFSPLAIALPERTSPEMLYLEAKFGARISFDLSRKLLAEVLPLHEEFNAATIRNHLHRIGERLEGELGEDGLPIATEQNHTIFPEST